MRGCPTWPGSTWIFEHGLSGQGWVAQLYRGVSPGFCTWGLSVLACSGQVWRWSACKQVLILEKLQKVISLNLHLSVIHLKHTSCLFWSDLMEFSNANRRTSYYRYWVSYKERAENISVFIDKQARLHQNTDGQLRAQFKVRYLNKYSRWLIDTV